MPLSFVVFFFLFWIFQWSTLHTKLYHIFSSLKSVPNSVKPKARSLSRILSEELPEPMEAAYHFATPNSLHKNRRLSSGQRSESVSQTLDFERHSRSLLSTPLNPDAALEKSGKVSQRAGIWIPSERRLDEMKANYMIKANSMRWWWEVWKSNARKRDIGYVELQSRRAKRCDWLRKRKGVSGGDVDFRGTKLNCQTRWSEKKWTEDKGDDVRSGCPDWYGMAWGEVKWGEMKRGEVELNEEEWS